MGNKIVSLNIMSKENAKSASYVLAGKTAIISINNMSDDEAYFHKSDNLVGVLSLRFDDVTGSEDYKMEESDGEKIRTFLKNVLPKIDRLIVHCEYGVSRSSGVAAAILKAVSGSDIEIFNNPKYCPNMHCYRTTFNALFDENGESLLPDTDMKFSIVG